MDSSAWWEYFADGPNAAHFAPIIEEPKALIVPAITLYEVFRRVLQQRDEGVAIACVALMQRGDVVDLNAEMAVYAAELGLRFNLPLADSVITGALAYTYERA